MTRLLALLWLALATPLAAQAPVSPQLAARATTLLALLRAAKPDPQDFAPAFLAAVPIERLAGVAAQLRRDNGAVVQVTSIAPEGADQAVVTVDYINASVTARIALEASAPHRFIGLLLIGVARKHDSLYEISTEMRFLPGRASLLVARLEASMISPSIAYNADRSFAVASQFKLFVLAELARATGAGERRWSDVVPLGPPSLPSGVMQDWPRATPVTLAALAVQAISISDNTAADTLLTVLGRDKVDAMRASFGTTPGALPMLATREAFVLKMDESATLRAGWTSGSMAERRALLARKSFDVASVDARQLASGPRFIESVEWPATPSEIARAFDRLRTSREALDILAVNPSLPPAERARFAYAGFKGGSETGVVSLGWMLRSKGGDWFVVEGVWNDPNAAVDNARFAALMQRVVALVGDVN